MRPVDISVAEPFRRTDGALSFGSRALYPNVNHLCKRGMQRTDGWIGPPQKNHHQKPPKTLKSNATIAALFVLGVLSASSRGSLRHVRLSDAWMMTALHAPAPVQHCSTFGLQESTGASWLPNGIVFLGVDATICTYLGRCPRPC